MNRRVILLIVFGALLVGNVFFGLQYYLVSAEARGLQAQAQKAEINERVLDFTALFVDKVLRANAAVDFDTRLSLENAVRNLKDSEILAEWNAFVKSDSELGAQDSVKKLLSTLVSKIRK